MCRLSVTTVECRTRQRVFIVPPTASLHAGNRPPSNFGAASRPPTRVPTTTSSMLCTAARPRRLSALSKSWNSVTTARFDLFVWPRQVPLRWLAARVAHLKTFSYPILIHCPTRTDLLCVRATCSTMYRRSKNVSSGLAIAKQIRQFPSELLVVIMSWGASRLQPPIGLGSYHYKTPTITGRCRPLIVPLQPYHSPPCQRS